MVRLVVLIVSLVTAVLVIALLARVLPEGGAAILLDIRRSTWPLTVQNILWLVFFAGLGELAIRWRAGWIEENQINRNYLPDDEETVLQARRRYDADLPESAATANTVMCVSFRG